MILSTMHSLNIVLISLLLPGGNCAGTDDDYINRHPSWKYLPTDVCGTTRFDKLNGRIVGGKEAKLGEFPFMCLLGFSFFGQQPEFTCGCALISQTLVLTAAHCDRSNNVVRVGENDMSTDIDCQGNVCAPHVQDIRVKKYLLNVYDKVAKRNDINMILLQKPAVFNDFVRPICLPEGQILSQDLMGSHVKVAGWGLTNSSDEGSVSARLMYMVAPIVDQEKCNNIYHNKLIYSQYCAGHDRGIDSCNGDSGGPMFKSMKNGQNRRIFLLGLTSFGLTRCGGGQAVYTRVDSFLPQILDTIYAIRYQ